MSTTVENDVIFVTCEKSVYDSITVKSSDTLYFVTDTSGLSLYKGSVKVGTDGGGGGGDLPANATFTSVTATTARIDGIDVDGCISGDLNSYTIVCGDTVHVSNDLGDTRITGGTVNTQLIDFTGATSGPVQYINGSEFKSEIELSEVPNGLQVSASGTNSEVVGGTYTGSTAAESQINAWLNSGTCQSAWLRDGATSALGQLCLWQDDQCHWFISPMAESVFRGNAPSLIYLGCQSGTASTVSACSAVALCEAFYTGGQGWDAYASENVSVTVSGAIKHIYGSAFSYAGATVRCQTSDFVLGSTSTSSLCKIMDGTIFASHMEALFSTVGALFRCGSTTIDGITDNGIVTNAVQAATISVVGSTHTSYLGQLSALGAPTLDQRGCIVVANLGSFGLKPPADTVLDLTTASSRWEGNGYALLDATTSGNARINHYAIVPGSTAEATILLPSVQQDSLEHTIVVDVTFSYVQAITFKQGGTTIVPSGTFSIVQDDVYTFLCLYIAGSWRVFPVKVNA